MDLTSFEPTEGLSLVVWTLVEVTHIDVFVNVTGLQLPLKQINTLYRERA